MLDAACPGEVFTSPVPDQILAATKAVDGGAGVVHIVKNYTGDVMNFQMAAELAGDEGITVETVLVDDDVAVEDSTWTAGRRGTGATLFVEKIAGALAEEGGSVADVAAIGRRVNEAVGSFAVALTACTTPAAGKPGFDLPDDEMEVGVGIHGEPGRRREKLQPGQADRARPPSTRSSPPSRSTAATGRSSWSTGSAARRSSSCTCSTARSPRCSTTPACEIARNLVGNYVTSLDMAGMSVTVCKADDEMLRLWDAPVQHARPAVGRASETSWTPPLARAWVAADRRGGRRSTPTT